MVDVGLLELAREKPKTGNDSVPAPAAVIEGDDVDDERVSRLRAFDIDRRDQARALQPFEHDGVARLDPGARRERVVKKACGCASSSW
jgi:hypothetical protein